VANRLVVRRPRDTPAAELRGRRARTLRVARADHYLVVAGGREPSGERAAEAARPTEDRNPHAGAPAASSAATASRRAASTSLISVRVTTARIPAGSGTGGSNSSTTSASMRPS